MKKVLFIILFFLISFFNSLGQKTETITVKGLDIDNFIAQTGYKYPSYSRAKVFLKDGDIASGRFNFDYFSQEMKYIGEKGDTLAIANAHDINFVAIGTDSFFYNKGYYEWIASSGIARLAVKHIFKLVERQNVGPFGISSSSTGVQKIGRVFGNGKPYDFLPNEELVFSKETTFYISPTKGKKNDFVVANKNNIDKLFPKINIEKFIKENKLNLNKVEDLLSVMVYISNN
jgi:hypothetical protein